MLDLSLLLVLGQSTDLVSMVYSCIGAEIEDSDASSSCDLRASERDADRLTAVSDAPADTATNGHAVSFRQQTDRQSESGRQERIVPLTGVQSEMQDDRRSGEDGAAGAPGGMKPEPPPQSSKPSLSVMRQRHLQESLGTATFTIRKITISYQLSLMSVCLFFFPNFCGRMDFV